MRILKNLLLLSSLPIIVLVTDLLVRKEILNQFNQRMFVFYLLSVAASFILYLFLLLLLNQVSRKLHRTISASFFAFVAFLYTFSLAGSYGYFFRANILPNYFVFHYMIQEPLNSFTLFKDSISIYSLVFPAKSGYLPFRFSFPTRSTVLAVLSYSKDKEA